MTIRDNALPKFAKARAKIAQLGLRRFSVTLRRRVWSGDEVGEGTCTNQDITLTPAPRVRFKAPYANQLAALQAAGAIRDRYYQVDKITPAFDDGKGNVGGYSPVQLRMRVGADMRNVDPVVVLLGDDGMLRECEQVLLEDDRSFGYSMLVQEADGPGVGISAIAVTPAAALAPGATLQLAATGTYADGQQYPVTSLVKWTSSNSAVLRVDLLGIVTAVADGAATVTASMGATASPPLTLTVSG